LFEQDNGWSGALERGTTALFMTAEEINIMKPWGQAAKDRRQTREGTGSGGKGEDVDDNQFHKLEIDFRYLLLSAICTSRYASG
jgi:hypothetical protein